MDDGRQPATKQDLLDLENRLETRFVTRFATKQDLLDLEGRLEARLEARFTEALHETETKLLTAFYGFAEATRKHLTDLDRSDFSLRERLDQLNGRLTEVEKRLNMPGA